MLGSCWDDPLPSAVFSLPRGWRKGSQSYPLGCLNRSTQTIFFNGFFIWLKFVMATWWVRWVVISIQQKYREESGWRQKCSSHTRVSRALLVVNSSNLYHQIAFFCVDFFSNTVNKHCCGLFFFHVESLESPTRDPFLMKFSREIWSWEPVLVSILVLSKLSSQITKITIAWQILVTFLEWWGKVTSNDWLVMKISRVFQVLHRLCIYLGSGPPT